MKLNRSQKRKAVKAGISLQRTIDLKNEITGATVQAVVVWSNDLEPTIVFIEDNKDVLYKVPALDFIQAVTVQTQEALVRFREKLIPNE